MTETRAASTAGQGEQPGARGWLSRKLQKLTADDQTVDARELQSDVVSAGCEPVSARKMGSAANGSTIEMSDPKQTSA